MQAYQIVLIVIASVAALTAAAILIFYFRLPQIFVKKTAAAFDNGDPEKPSDFDTYERRVKRIENIAYKTPLPNGVYDLYLPDTENKPDSLPVIFWIHGGGFTAGTKDGTQVLCTMLCAEGYAVVSTDYAYAPKYKFPTVSIQIADAVSSLKDLKKSYPELDLQKVIIGGDSAGGHYCAQYAAAHTNKRYADALGIKTADVNLVGVVLCCAPIDIATMLPPVNFKLKLLADTFFNGYFGFSPKKKRRGKKLSALREYVTKDFPPSFITDGNTYSFENQNRDLGKRLAELGVKTDELYFDKQTFGTVNHEYLFELGTERAADGYKRLTDFLKTL